MIKKMFASNWPTIILNVAMLTAGVGTYLVSNEVVMQNPEVVALLTSIVAGANVVLRVLGRTPIQPATPSK